jgi:uncharacterized protein (TIGR03382 family)
VYLPATTPTRTAAQWFQVDPISLTPTQSGRIDDGTSVVDYAYPSLAVNANDDMFVAYSQFSGSSFASIGYTMRFHGDALGSLRDPTIGTSGAGSYVKLLGGALNRWGRYTATAIDPSNLGFWTLQIAAAAPAGTPCTVDCGRWAVRWMSVAVTCALSTCVALDECHDPGTCDEVTGCTNPNAPDNTTCSTGFCEAGVCVPPVADDAGVQPDADTITPDAGGNPAKGSGGGCCHATSGDTPAGALVLGLGVLSLLSRRRRAS